MMKLVDLWMNMAYWINIDRHISNVSDILEIIQESIKVADAVGYPVGGCG